MIEQKEVIPPSPPKPEKEKKGFFSRLFSKREHEAKKEDVVFSFPDIPKEDVDILSKKIEEPSQKPSEMEIPELSEPEELPELSRDKDEELSEDLSGIKSEQDIEMPEAPVEKLDIPEFSGFDREPSVEDEYDAFDEKESEEPGWAVSSEKAEPVPDSIDEQESFEKEEIDESELNIPEMKSVEEETEKIFSDVKKQHEQIDKELEKIIVKKPKLDVAAKLKMKVPKENYFWLKNGKAIRSFKELLDAMEFIDEETFRHHVTENRNDFANWVKDILEEEKLAEKIRTKTAKEDLLKILKDHESKLIKKFEKQQKDIKEKERKIKELSDNLEKIRELTKRKSKAILEERQELSKRVQERMHAEAESILKEKLRDIKKRESALKRKESGLKKKEEKTTLLEKEWKTRIREVERREKAVEKKKKETSEKITELKDIEKELKADIKKNQAIEKKIKIKKKKLDEIEKLKKSLKKKEQMLKEEKDAFKTFVQKEKKKLEQAGKNMKAEYEKLKRKLEDEREIYHEIQKAKDSVETQKRLMEKEGFERYLRSKLSETVAGDKDDNIMPDIHKIKHIKIYNLIDDCKKSLESGDIARAKHLYNNAKNEFTKLKLQPIEKHMLYNSLRELYDDIHLAILGE